MNKYQEALNIFCEQNIFNCISKDILNENYLILQELVDKATPKKLVKEVDGRWARYFCPCCNKEIESAFDNRIVNKWKHCYECGQKLDWSEDE